MIITASLEVSVRAKSRPVVREHLPVWLEWQTRSTQNRVSERTCGFDSHHRYMERESGKRQIEFITPLRSVKGGMSLADLLRITEGLDPENVLIGTSFRYPSEVALEIYSTEMRDAD